MEHKFIILTITFGLIGWFSVSTLLNIFVFDKTYKQNELVKLNEYNLTVTSSYLIRTDMLGKDISEKYQYFAVNTRINNFIPDNIFKLNNLSIDVNGSTYSPYTMYSNFIGYGVGYPENQILSTQNPNNYMFVFRIPKDVNVKKATLRYLYNTTYEKELPVLHYRRVKLDYIENVQAFQNNIKKVGEKMNINESTLTISSIDFSDQFRYDYKYCIATNMCMDSVGYVRNNDSKYKILKIDTNFDIKDNLKGYQINNAGSLISNLGIITYTKDNKDYYEKNIKNITPSNAIGGSSYFVVSKDIMNASNINIELLINGTKYIYNLKGE